MERTADIRQAAGGTMPGGVVTEVRGQAAAARGTDWRALLWGGNGLLHLLLHGAAELTELVTEMDGTIRQRPWPLGRVDRHPRQVAPWPYRLVSRIFRQAATLLRHVPVSADIRQSHALALPLLSAVNGVMGDKLERWDSPLALGMTLRDGDSELLAWSDLAASPKARVALFLHGLCLSEREWQTPAQREFATLLRRKGWQPGWLRYNSGRPIWHNGADLADWLEEALAAHPVRELVLVGHSMGGLLMRSAFEHARRHGQQWPGKVSRAAYLATPHLGAPLERAGNWANAILSKSPYTLPLMRLGNIRSAAIKDLRFGLISEDESAAASDVIHHDQREALAQLPAGVRHFMLGGTRPGSAPGSWVGDGLVPLDSALGRHASPALTLAAPMLTRVALADMDHLAMLGDVRVWEALADWWFRD